MNTDEVLMRFIQMDKSSRDSILRCVVDDYAEYIYHIAEDIYDSCIQDFYDQYTPMRYDRHGNLSGFNLYSGKNFFYSNLWLDIQFDPDNLLPYYKMRKTSSGDYVQGAEELEDKRAYVLGSVMTGVRARRSPRTPAWFPMRWRTSYPNSFSEMYDWTSSKTTISSIFDDFCENVVNETTYKFYEILGEYV